MKKFLVGLLPLVIISRISFKGGKKLRNRSFGAVKHAREDCLYTVVVCA